MNWSDRAASEAEARERVGRHLERIVAAAERAAREIVDEAEETARRRLEQADARAERLLAERLAGLAELAEALRRQAEAIGRHGERLLGALEGARGGVAAEEPAAEERAVGERAAGEGGAQPPGPEPRRAGARRAHLSAVEPPVSGREPAGARLLATQMAVSGSSREEIDRRLRNGFEIEDTSAILDAILGPED